MPKIKNIIIFIVIAIIFVLIYVYFIKGSTPDTASLVSSPGSEVMPSADTSLTTENNSAIAREFLGLLLSVKDIKLNDAIFSDNVFTSLHDSSIILTPDGNEGRINPFAPLGTDATTTTTTTTTTTNTTLPLTCALPKILDTLTDTCVTPLTCALPKVLNTTTNTCVNLPAN